MSYATVSRHEEFCIGIASGMTAEQAYIRAGYSENGAAQSASRLLRNAQIRSRIRGLRKAMAEQAISQSALTKEYVISHLMTIVEQCMQERPIQDKDGNILGYSTYKPMAAIRALELLGKELGMFVGRPERKTAYDHMTLEELDQRSAELDRQIEALEQQPEPPCRRRRLRRVN